MTCPCRYYFQYKELVEDLAVIVQLPDNLRRYTNTYQEGRTNVDWPQEGFTNSLMAEDGMFRIKAAAAQLATDDFGFRPTDIEDCTIVKTFADDITSTQYLAWYRCMADPKDVWAHAVPRGHLHVCMSLTDAACFYTGGQSVWE